MSDAVEIANAYVVTTLKFESGATRKALKAELGSVDAEDEGKQVGQRFAGGFAIGGAIAGVASQLTQQATAAIGDFLSQAAVMSDGVQKFEQTLSFAGLDTSAIDEAQKKTRAYADSTVYDLTTIQNTTAQLAANGIPNYEELTEAAGNLNAVAGGNADTFSSVAMVLTQTAGAGKLTTENWNQLANAIPGASGVLQDALLKAGAYTGNFRDAMEKGEITADEFNAALMQVGTEPVAVEAAKSTSTFEGALGNLQAAITGALADALTAVKPYVTDFVSGLSDAVVWIQGNVSWLGPLAAGLVAAAVAIGVYNTAMGLYAAYQTAAAAAEGGLTVAQWLLNASMLASPVTWIILGIAALVAAVILLWQNWDAVTAWITQVWAGFVSWLGDVMNGLAAWWNGIWQGISSFFTGIWNGIVTWAEALFASYVGWLMGVGNSVSAWWNGLWSGVGNFFTGVWNGLVSWGLSVFMSLWSGIQSIGSAINGFWSGLWNGVSSVFQGAWNGIAGFFKGIANSVLGMIEGFVNGAIDLINGAISGLSGSWTWLGIPAIPTIGHVSLPQLAEGGIVRAQPGGILANLGEGRYDEAVIPLSPKVLAQVGAAAPSKTLIYHAAPNQSFDAEQDLQVALARLGYV